HIYHINKYIYIVIANLSIYLRIGAFLTTIFQKRALHGSIIWNVSGERQSPKQRSRKCAEKMQSTTQKLYQYYIYNGYKVYSKSRQKMQQKDKIGSITP
ncbi:MAG: hypothetical protein LUH36_02250, partial [Oscillospiraceae bacterium]|nr:hypothetical protein [Oscillospiraceae bacterium]